MKSNVLLVALSAAVLASCGAANGASPNQTVLDLTPTNYVTVTQTPTTLTADHACPAVPATPAPCTRRRAPTSSPPATTRRRIASKYKVKFDDLLAINGWTLVGRSGARVQSGARRDDQDPTGLDRARHRRRHRPASTGTTPPTETTTTIAGGQSTCAPGEYTIVAEDDYPAKVAKKLDTTVDALNAANVNTPGYSSFYPGLKIKTPPKANC